MFTRAFSWCSQTFESTARRRRAGCACRDRCTRTRPATYSDRWSRSGKSAGTRARSGARRCGGRETSFSHHAWPVFQDRDVRRDDELTELFRLLEVGSKSAFDVNGRCRRFLDSLDLGGSILCSANRCLVVRAKRRDDLLRYRWSFSFWIRADRQRVSHPISCVHQFPSISPRQPPRLAHPKECNARAGRSHTKTASDALGRNTTSAREQASSAMRDCIECIERIR